MTRKGKVPINIPSGAEVKIDKNKVSVKGPKGTVYYEMVDGVHARLDGQNILVTADENPELKKFHGLAHALITNMLLGTTKGFEKKLEMIGVGFRAAVQGKLLNLQVGFSHPTNVQIPEGIEVKVEKNTNIIITGNDKQRVGQFAATVRGMKPPEPYQGKGIRYSGEYVRKKAGKAAGKK